MLEWRLNKLGQRRATVPTSTFVARLNPIIGPQLPSLAGEEAELFIECRLPASCAQTVAERAYSMAVTHACHGREPIPAATPPRCLVCGIKLKPRPGPAGIVETRHYRVGGVRVVAGASGAEQDSDGRWYVMLPHAEARAVNYGFLGNGYFCSERHGFDWGVSVATMKAEEGGQITFYEGATPPP